jgi:hypothetical protein
MAKKDAIEVTVSGNDQQVGFLRLGDETGN